MMSYRDAKNIHKRQIKRLLEQLINARIELYAAEQRDAIDAAKQKVDLIKAKMAEAHITYAARVWRRGE